MINNKQTNQQRATKAVILARVSSKEQEDGYSLAAQENNAKAYCNNKGYHVLKVFSFVESSTQGDRKQFHEMLNYIRQQNDCIAIISDTVDRFQRSFRETLELDPMIKAGKVELHFIKNGLIVHKDSSASDTTMWRMCVLMAESYVLTLSDNTKRGLNQKINNGEWPSKAPVGYKNVEINGRKTIILDPIAAPLVKKFFEDYATGNYSMDQAARTFKKAGLISCKGVPFNAASMQRTISNPFYYGVMNVKGNLIPHKYGSIISKQLFDKCQQIREGFNRKAIRYDRLQFPFKRMLKCACCGSYISSYNRYKKNKTNNKEHHYVYLRCAGKANQNKCSCKEIREELAIDAVMKKLKTIQVPSILLKDALSQLIGKVHTQTQVGHSIQVSAHRRLGQIEKEKEVWIQKEASGLINSTTVNAKLQALADEEKTLQERLKSIKTVSNTAAWTLARAINLISRLPELFAGSQNEQKRKILNLIFANLILKDKTIEFTTKKPFSYFAEGSNRLVMGRLVNELYNYLISPSYASIKI